MVKLGSLGNGMVFQIGPNGNPNQTTVDAIATNGTSVYVGGRFATYKGVAMTYKSKSNQSTRWGHRQRYSTIAIRSISAAG